MKKLITIDTRGPIWLKQGIIGPIITPYLEEVSLITVMLRQGLAVTEVLETGERLPLTLENVELNNNDSHLNGDLVDGYHAEEVVSIPANVISPAIEANSEPLAETVEPATIETTKVEEPIVQHKAGKKGGK